MPLFSNRRDAKLVRHFSKELMHRFISIECSLYKLALPEMEINIYNESNKKVYHNPVRLFCLVNKDPSTFVDTDTGIDLTQTLQFKFLRDDLKENNIYIDEGDILKYDEKYYEVDNTAQQQYWMGRNDETIPIEVEGRDTVGHGYNISILVLTHLTRVSQLNLIEVRSGINKSHHFPKNL